MNVNEWKAEGISVLRRPCRFQAEVPSPFRVSEAAAPRHFHEKLAAYEKTPLLSFPALAKKLGVKGVYTKDESGRFSLNAFKGLGGSYAMFRILCEKFSLDPETASPEDLTQGDNGEKVRQMDFVTCTDGNHGRGVAWAAGLFGCRAHVYMPRGTCRARVEAIRQIGSAEVVVTDKSYDDTVLYAKAMSEKHGWTLIQDTSWEGYEKIPTWIIQGYLTLASEMTEQLEGLGIKVYKEGCALEIQAKKRGISSMMSNSGKFGTYSFGLTGIQPVFGTLNECIETAVAGKLIREAKPWRK